MVITQFCIGALLVIGIQTFAQSCPGPGEFYIHRNANIYCKKIYNCPPGHEIIPCNKTCAEERCVPCSEGKAQPYLSHSDQLRACFTPESQCNSRDTIPIQNGTFSPSCAMQKYCACNNSKCFYGSPCICERNFSPCGVNEEMNSKGNCVRCKKGYQKLYKGCDQCERIVPELPSTPAQQTNGTTASKPNPVKTELTSPSTRVPVPYATTKTTQKPEILVSSPPGGSPQGHHPEKGEDNSGTILIVVFVVVGIILVALIIVILLMRKYGRRRFIAKICRDREAADQPGNHVNGDVGRAPELEHVTIPPETDISCNIRPELMRLVSSDRSDSGYEHHPSLESQISHNSHISVSTPVQVTDGGEDLHPLLRTVSHDPDASNYIGTNSSPVSASLDPASLRTSTLDTPSVGSMAVSEPINEDINLDVKGANPTISPCLTEDINSGHEDNDVRLGCTAVENEEDTQEKSKDSTHLDSLQIQKKQIR